MEFVAATNNRNKLAELNRLFADSGHTLIGLAEAGVYGEPEENGETYAANAFIKARAAAKMANMPAIGDDSGLEVDALSGAPGIRSARFAGENAGDEENNKRLLFLLERMPFAARKAHFVCVLAVVLPEGDEMAVEGRLDGIIGFGPSGVNGFGYDPLFYVDSRSLADRSDEEKDTMSHRGLAVKELLAELPGFLRKNGL